jgi:hypothetical protein
MIVSNQPPLSVAVILPSRLDRIDRGPQAGLTFLERAIASALAQGTVENGSVALTFIVGVDADAEVPDVIATRPDTTIARSSAKSQAAALNAAILAADRFPYIAFLEDDDRWDPNYLGCALPALLDHGFVSTTQLELDENDEILRVNDFPTPSGWIMSAQTLRRVGLFDTTMRWHLDNEWLGRLAEAAIPRCHLVERTAPVTLAHSEQTRPWIANVIRNGGPHVLVRRHLLFTPLVLRLVHSRSGMGRIAQEPALQQESHNEYVALATRYGRVPW